MSKVIKKLDIKTLEKVRTKTFTKKKIIVTAKGQDYEVIIDEKFKVGQIKNLILEYFTDCEYLISHGHIEITPQYLKFLILKYFTNIDILQESKTMEQKINTWFILVEDFGILDTIVNHFDEKELNEVVIYINQAKENLDKLTKDKELMKEYSDLLSLIEDKKDAFFVEDEIVEDESKEEIIESE